MLESCTKEKQESAESKVLLESHEFIRGRIQKQRGCQEKPAEVIGIARDGCWHENHGHIQDQGDNQQQ